MEVLKLKKNQMENREVQLTRYTYLILFLIAFNTSFAQKDASSVEDSLFIKNIKWEYEFNLKESILYFVVENKSGESIFYDEDYLFTEFCISLSSDYYNCINSGKPYLDPRLIKKNFKELQHNEKVKFTIGLNNKYVIGNKYQITSNFYFFRNNKVFQEINQDTLFNTSRFFSSYNISLESRDIIKRKNNNLKGRSVILNPEANCMFVR